MLQSFWVISAISYFFDRYTIPECLIALYDATEKYIRNYEKKVREDLSKEKVGDKGENKNHIYDFGTC